MPDGMPVASRDAPVGGQAVLEGVMMRGVSTWAVGRAEAGRDGSRSTSEPLVSWAKRNRVLRWPVIRGVVALAESLRIGFRALAISANAQIEPEDGEEPEPIGGFVWGATIALSLVLAIGLFFVIPVGATSLIKDQLGSRSSSGSSRGSSAPRSSSATSSRSAACATCGGCSSTTAPSTRRSPATRRATG